jgi:hypothetical protein
VGAVVTNAVGAAIAAELAATGERGIGVLVLSAKSARSPRSALDGADKTIVTTSAIQPTNTAAAKLMNTALLRSRSGMARAYSLYIFTHINQILST